MGSLIRGSVVAVVVTGALFCTACGKSDGEGPLTPTPFVPIDPVDPNAPAPLTCPTQTTGQSGPTYYVAINQPGADNERCDGLSPVDRGNGRCPFKDFQSARTFRLLLDVAGVRVEVRAGTYTFVDEGLTIKGSGNSESSRVVLTAYQNESVVFDGRNVLRELIRLAGRYTAIERVTLQHAGGYNLQIGEGHHHVVQCNRFLANMASDSLKGTGGAGTTLIRYNDFSQWDSQAIDMTNVRDWTIEENDFHDPKANDGNATVTKLGTRNVVIRRNRFRNTRGLAFGGTSGPHTNDFEAYDIVAEHNRFDNVPSAVVKFYSCSDCVFRDNDVRGAGAGFILGGDAFDGPSGCGGGCRPTRGAIVTRNRLSDMMGGREGEPDTFWFVNSNEAGGLVAEENLYCTRGQPAKFFFDRRAVTFAEWTQMVRTDSTSRVASGGDAACASW